MGYWKKETKFHKDNDQAFYYYKITCSKCGSTPQKSWELTPYCPYCGEKMQSTEALEEKENG